MFALLFLYGLSHIPQMYLFSYFFSVSATGFASLVAWNILSSKILSLYLLDATNKIDHFLSNSRSNDASSRSNPLITPTRSNRCLKYARMDISPSISELLNRVYKIYLFLIYNQDLRNQKEIINFLLM